MTPTRRPDRLAGPLGPIFGRPPEQIALLVHDLDRAVERHASIWGLGPWSCYRYDGDLLRERTFRGAPSSYSMLIALASGRPQVELIQPLEGPSIYHEWMAERGEGMHHVAFDVDDIDAATAEIEGAGYPMIQSGAGFGLDGDGAFAYFDTVDDLGLVVEVREIPKRRVPAARVVGAS